MTNTNTTNSDAVKNERSEMDTRDVLLLGTSADARYAMYGNITALPNVHEMDGRRAGFLSMAVARHKDKDFSIYSKLHLLSEYSIMSLLGPSSSILSNPATIRNSSASTPSATELDAIKTSALEEGKTEEEINTFLSEAYGIV